MNKNIIPIALVLVVLLAGLALWFGLRGNVGTRGGNTDVTVFAPEGTSVIVIPGSSENTDAESVEAADGAVTHVVPSSGELDLDLDNGDYEVLANRGSEYNPWLKQITIASGVATELYPFFLPKEPVLEETDDTSVIGAFATPAILPTSTSPRINNDETAELYVSNGTAFIRWTGEVEDMPEFLCSGENVEDCRLQPVFNFGTLGVENLEFYGEHDELLMADLGQMVVAIEVDRRGTQNRQPAYVGASPVAFRIIDGVLYVSEAGVASKIVLD